MITEADASGNTLRAEIYAGDRHLATWTNKATYFNHADWLGTERARSNSSGSRCETITSLPFRDGMSTNGTCTPTPTFFTGKERDQESGLDNFGARYLATSTGRFTSTDPLMNSGHPWAPQTWNRYAYAQNNPLRYVDPTGLYDYDKTCKNGSAGAWCRQELARFDAAVNKGWELLKTLPKDSKEYKALKKSLDAIGTRGDKNGVMVGFGQTVTGSPMETQGNHITVDWSVQDFGLLRYKMAGYDTKADVLDASGVSHEGIHLVRKFPIGARNMWDIDEAIEREAYGVESTVDEAGHSETVLWNSSWANSADKEVLRQKAIREMAHESVEATREAYKKSAGGEE